MHGRLRLFLVPLFVAVCSSAVDAQIHSWRDANGFLVLSNRLPAPPLTIDGVAATEPIRVSTPLVLPRSSFEPLIREHAASHRVRADLVRAVIQVESAFNPGARSPKGAMGLMQLMPTTA